MITYDPIKQTFSSKLNTYKINQIPATIIYEWVKTGQLSRGNFIIYLAHVTTEVK